MDNRYYYTFLFFIILFFLLAVPSRRQVFSVQEVTRDTTVVNVIYRDSTVYNIEVRDSVVVDYSIVPTTEIRIDTIRDTAFVFVPVTWHHFHDSVADIYCTGYKVTLDSVRYHFREVTKMVTESVVVKPRRLSVEAGLMLMSRDKAYSLSCDITAAMRLGERWSVEAGVGFSSDGSALMPYVGAGVRYRAW